MTQENAKGTTFNTRSKRSHMPRRKTKRRVLSGLGAAKKKPKGRRVSRKAATRKGKGGRRVLKKGCRYLKGDGAMCTTPTRKRKSSKRKSKKKGSKKKVVHAYSPRSPRHFKKGKKGRKVLKKGCRKRTAGKYKGKIVCKRKMSRRKKAA